MSLQRKIRKDKGTIKPLHIKLRNPHRTKNKDIFVKNSRYPRHRLKQRILECSLIKYVCAMCNSLPVWRDKKLTLVLDHINGINNDNRLDNLRFVCPNCESQLPTYKSKNITYQKQLKEKTL